MIFGMLVAQEDLLRLNREKLTLRFKSNSPERKLAAKMGSYLSGLLYFLGVLEVSLLETVPHDSQVWITMSWESTSF